MVEIRLFTVVVMSGLIIKIKLNKMIFDYFFFKLYNHYLNSKVPEYPRFLASTTFGLFLNFNLLDINTILAKSDILPFIYHFDDKIFAYLSTPVIATILFLIYNKNRIEVLKLKFAEEEFNPRKKKLNIIFALYIVLTILSFFVLPWWKPGYMPTIID